MMRGRRLLRKERYCASLLSYACVSYALLLRQRQRRHESSSHVPLVVRTTIPSTIYANTTDNSGAPLRPVSQSCGKDPCVDGNRLTRAEPHRPVHHHRHYQYKHHSIKHELSRVPSRRPRLWREHSSGRARDGHGEIGDISHP
jgi:predicted restriction endonuclease